MSQHWGPFARLALAALLPSLIPGKEDMQHLFLKWKWLPQLPPAHKALSWRPSRDVGNDPSCKAMRLSVTVGNTLLVGQTWGQRLAVMVAIPGIDEPPASRLTRTTLDNCSKTRKGASRLDIYIFHIDVGTDDRRRRVLVLPSVVKVSVG